jgi:hypothetical protein
MGRTVLRWGHKCGHAAKWILEFSQVGRVGLEPTTEGL